MSYNVKKKYNPDNLERHPDFSAPKTEYVANISNYASMDQVGKKDIGLESTYDFSPLEGASGAKVKGSPLLSSLPKGQEIVKELKHLGDKKLIL